MRPKLEMVGAEALIRMARHNTLRANIGIQAQRIKPKVTFELLLVASTTRIAVNKREEVGKLRATFSPTSDHYLVDYVVLPLRYNLASVHTTTLYFLLYLLLLHPLHYHYSTHVTKHTTVLQSTHMLLFGPQIAQTFFLPDQRRYFLLLISSHSQL